MMALHKTTKEGNRAEPAALGVEIAKETIWLNSRKSSLKSILAAVTALA
jgi:hypothetical protein